MKGLANELKVLTRVLTLTLAPATVSWFHDKFRLNADAGFSIPKKALSLLAMHSVEVMESVALSVSLLMAGLLLWAGLEKTRDLPSLASALQSLGAARWLAGPVAGLVTAAEIGVGLGLVFQPQMAWTQTGVAGLALAFAVAGFLALRRDEPIRCNCFGSGGSGRLGRRQVLALLPWTAGLAILYAGLPGLLPVDQGALRLCALGLTLATWQAINVWREKREAQGDRLSAQEMFLWPH